MKIIHAAIKDGQLVIWGERKLDPEKDSLPKRKGRRPKNPPPEPHPYHVNKDELCSVLGMEPQIEKALVWLPSDHIMPLPSSMMIADHDCNHPKISRWSIEGAFLSPDQTISFLKQCNGKELLQQGVVLGKEVAYLVNVLKFTLTLIIRQRYLPTVQQTKNGYRATWEPLFFGNDQERFAQLCQQFPDVLRCLSDSMKQQEAPSEPPSVILCDFIKTLIENLITSTQIPKKKRRSFDTIHDEWSYRLCHTESDFKTKKSDCQRLVQQISDWKRPLTNVLTSPYQFCFRLEEPEQSEEIKTDIAVSKEPWYMRYLLQARDDPSLLVETKEIWNPKGAKRKVLEKEGFNARQFVLACLGIASGLSEQVESSLEAATPDGYNLNGTDALTFLNESAAAFEDAGFGVILPAWWTGKKPKIKAGGWIESPMQSTSGKSLWEMIKVDWKIALGDENLTLEELQVLAKLKEPLVMLRGKWVQLNQDEIQKAILFLKKRTSKEMTLHEVVQMSLGTDKKVDGLDIGSIEATGWISDFLKQLQGNVKMETLKTPKEFRGTLRPYQVKGYSWLSFMSRWGLGACLADDMGLGKTPQTLALIQCDWSQKKTQQPTLLICPTSVIGNWYKEVQKFVPKLPVMVHHGADRKKGENFMKEAIKYGLVVSSYALLHRDFETFAQIEWRGVILDEAQNIKNSQTKQTKAAFQLKAEYRIVLTGTPVENHVGDLWSIMHFLNPGFLGTVNDFKQTYFKPIQLQGNQAATEKLKKLTSPFMLRRVKTDKSIINDLPDKMEMDVYCSLSKEQASLYSAVIGDAQMTLEKMKQGIKRKGIVLATLMKLKQICNHPAQFLKDGNRSEERSGKMKRLQEMLEEVIDIGDRALVFTQFREMGQILKDKLEETLGHEILFLHGGVSKKKRDHMVERFQEESPYSPKIFILSLKAGGTGLNLTNANHVFHFDRWWNPAVENQATDRAFRIGQKKNVQVHKFMCSGTLEEKIAEMIENKKKIADNVVGTGEGWLTGLSTDELCNLWKLRTEV